MERIMLSVHKPLPKLQLLAFTILKMICFPAVINYKYIYIYNIQLAAIINLHNLVAANI